MADRLILIKREGGFMSNNQTRKCLICEKDAEFIGYIDKESKRDISIELIENYRMPGGFLSGSLRKYRCPDGHEFTNA